MIRIEGTRFGTIEVDDDGTVELPQGLVGFPDETRFVLVPPKQGGRVAYFQSLKTPLLALAVVDASVFGPDYPSPAPSELAADAGLGPEISVLVAIAERDRGLTANLLAPIIVDLETRRGAQVVLDPRKFSAFTPIVAEEERGESATL